MQNVLDQIADRDAENALNYLYQFLTEERKELFADKIDKRTNFFTVVLEDIFQAQNASAVLRTCDCLGIASVNIIENVYDYTINPEVTKGSNKWLNINHYRKVEGKSSRDCLLDLKQNGYQIMATSIGKNSTSLLDFKPVEPIALVFGTEQTGISKDVEELADGFIEIPNYGFTQSYNLSVAAAIVLFELTKYLHNSKLDWKLSEKERIQTLLKWAHGSVRKPDIMLSNYLGTIK